MSKNKLNEKIIENDIAIDKTNYLKSKNRISLRKKRIVRIFFLIYLGSFPSFYLFVYPG